MDIDKDDKQWLKHFDFDIGLGYDSDSSDAQPKKACVACKEVKPKDNIFEVNYENTDDESLDDNQETSCTMIKKEGVTKDERDKEHNNLSELYIAKDENLSSVKEGHEKDQENDNKFDYIKWSEFKDADILSMRFDSSDEAFTFYNEYAKYMGFSVRKDVYRKTGDGVPISRRFVCSKQGMKEKKHLDRLDNKRPSRSVIRCNCLAFIRLSYEFESHKWVVKGFEAKHNHDLAPFPNSLFLRSHRNVSSGDGALAHGLTGVGIKKSQVMDYVIHKAGGFEKVGYTRKDFYNFMDKGKKEVLKDGDSMTLLGHMDNKSKLDPLFHYKYEYNEDKQLIRLFWADKRSCADYTRFGDVLLFDSTYRTNVYKMAFVLFAGINNHHQTVIFGCALMTSESEEAYTWALSTLIDTMGGRTPKSVITDGDAAIRKSIKNVLPSSSHRVCSWHIMQNCLKNIHLPGFAKGFCKLMYHHWTPKQFEDEWKKLVTTYDVSHLAWIQKMYKKRTRWAEAYLRGLFFAGCRSNQRCESLNAMIRHHVNPNLKITELYQKIEWAIERIRHRTHEEEVRTLMTAPSIDSHLPVYEKYAAVIYTRSSYQIFREQLKAEALYTVVDMKLNDQNIKTFTLSRHQKRESQYFVEYNIGLKTIKCTCTLFESYGFPCKHIISSLKHGDVEEVPSACILQRWTRQANEGISMMGKDTIDVKIQSAIRHSELMEACNQLCLMACRSEKDFEYVKSFIGQTTNSVMTHAQDIKKTWTKRSTSSPSKGGEQIDEPPFVAKKRRPNPKKARDTVIKSYTQLPTHSPSKGTEHIHEPPLVASKGAPISKRPRGFSERKRPKMCSHCKIKGHTRPTCPSIHSKTTRKGVVTPNEVVFLSSSTKNVGCPPIFQPIHDGYCDPLLGPRFRFA